MLDPCGRLYNLSANGWVSPTGFQKQGAAGASCGRMPDIPTIPVITEAVYTSRTYYLLYRLNHSSCPFAVLKSTSMPRIKLVTEQDSQRFTP